MALDGEGNVTNILFGNWEQWRFSAKLISGKNTLLIGENKGGTAGGERNNVEVSNSSLPCIQSFAKAMQRLRDTHTHFIYLITRY